MRILQSIKRKLQIFKRIFFAIAIAIRSTAYILNANNRGKFNLNRSFGKRLTRLKLCAVMILMLLFFTLYSSIFSGSSRHYPLQDWEFSVSRNISDYVLPLNETTLLEPRQKCNEKMFILILVCSSLNNFVERQTIRETWGNTTEFNYNMFEKLHAHLKGNYLQPKEQRIKFYLEFLKLNGNQTLAGPPSTLPVRIVFLLGHTKADNLMDGGGVGKETQIRLQKEAEQYDDIIQENFIDSYNNLTIKVVMALKWITRNNCFQQAAFFMKCDDDIFVNIPNLLQFLLGGTVPLYNETLDYYDGLSYQTLSAMNRLNATSNYIVGYKFCRAPVIKNFKNKFYMPYYMYPQDKYPTYLSGSGYLMSMDVVPKLYQAALSTDLVHLEDVYVTGMCAEKANFTRHHHPLFNLEIFKHNCSLKGMISLHKLWNDDMYAAYNFVTNVTYQCPPPGKYFKRIRLSRVNDCGSGYLMSMDVVPKLYQAALSTDLVHLEDVYVTGMCAEKANFTRHHHPLFNLEIFKHNCTLKGMISLHKLWNDDMYAAYNFVTNVTYRCPPPGKYFKRIRLSRVNDCG